MDAVVFAVGRGARMGALSARKNKVALHFCGKPIICWVLEDLLATPLVDTIWVTTGYAGESVHEAVNKHFKGTSGERIRWSDDTRARGTTIRLWELLREHSFPHGCLAFPADAFVPLHVLQQFCRYVVETAVEIPLICLSPKRETAPTHLLIRHEGHRVLEASYPLFETRSCEGWSCETSLRYLPPKLLANIYREGTAEGITLAKYMNEVIARGERVDAIHFEDDWFHFAHASDFKRGSM